MTDLRTELLQFNRIPLLVPKVNIQDGRPQPHQSCLALYPHYTNPIRWKLVRGRFQSKKKPFKVNDYTPLSIFDINVVVEYITSQLQTHEL